MAGRTTLCTLIRHTKKNPTHLQAILWITGILLLFIPFYGEGCLIVKNSNQQPSIIKTIPYTLPWDDMPIDLSFIFNKEKPAGKHGFLKVEGNKFIFEDGTEARFWGTNFNSAQNFPSHEHSEKLAKRLAKIGVNIVRLHQLDAEWSTPNIFQFTKGKNKPDTQSFDPESMDRLDYLIKCLKQEGIYIYMDLLTYRRFKTGDGIEAADKLGDGARPYSLYNRRLIELQKKFNSDFWTYVNPYTGLAYKDDPVMVLTDIANENSFFLQKAGIEPYRSELEDLYRKWAKNKNINVSKNKVEFNLDDKTIQRFFIEIQQDYYNEMMQHMRELGVKIPVTGSNLCGDWSRRWGNLSSQMSTDYIDSHYYWRGGSHWRDENGVFGNLPMIGNIDNILAVFAFSRAAGKPFFISEWDQPWPNEWRAESSLLMAAAGSFQGWGGLTIHTYRYTLDEDVNMIGKPITSGAIGGSYIRGGVFDTFNDPAKFGLFYHAALIMRRGDVKPAEKTVAIKVTDYFVPPFPVITNALQLTTEKHRVEIVLPGKETKGDIITSPEKTIVDVESGEVLSDTKELYRNLHKKIGWINSPRTKVVYGFVGKEGELALTDLKINVKTDFATVAISSLTDEPVKSSSNMLLTAVGRAENTNSVYNEDRTQQLNPGHGPIQVEIIEATIEIKTENKNLRVLAINPQGFIIGYIPSEYKNDIFKFEIGKEFQSMYYLIQD